MTLSSLPFSLCIQVYPHPSLLIFCVGGLFLTEGRQKKQSRPFPCCITFFCTLFSRPSPRRRQHLPFNELHPLSQAQEHTMCSYANATFF